MLTSILLVAVLSPEARPGRAAHARQPMGAVYSTPMTYGQPAYQGTITPTVIDGTVVDGTAPTPVYTTAAMGQPMMQPTYTAAPTYQPSYASAPMYAPAPTYQPNYGGYSFSRGGCSSCR